MSRGMFRVVQSDGQQESTRREQILKSGWRWRVALDYFFPQGVQTHPATLKMIRDMLPDHTVFAEAHGSETCIGFGLPDGSQESRQFALRYADRFAALLTGSQLVDKRIFHAVRDDNDWTHTVFDVREELQ